GEISSGIDVSRIREVDGNRFVRFADFYRHPMILNEQPDLLGQIGTEQIGPGYRGLIDAGAGHKAVGKTRVQPGMRTYGHANKRIRNANARMKPFAPAIRFELIAQETGIAVVDVPEPVNGGSRLAEIFGSDQFRR